MIEPLSNQGLAQNLGQNILNLDSVNHIVFIDSGVESYQDLVAGVNQAEVVILEPALDGIAQITTAIEQYQNIDSLQIISHGNAGQLRLGATDLNQENLDDYAQELTQWSKHLSEDADILLFGCEIGANQEFIQSLGAVTQADIAASSNLTGYQDLNGDWQLEINLGEIESTLQIDQSSLESYQSVLAISNDNFADDLVLELNFNDSNNSGNLTLDSSPQRNNGQLRNGAALVQAKEPFTQALKLDGIDDYLKIANSSELNLAAHAQRTVSLWFNAADINRSTPQIIYEEGGTARGLNIYLDQGQLYVGGWNKIESNWSGTFLHSGLNTNNSSGLSSDTWHHVAVVLDTVPESRLIQPEVMFAYLDGVEIGRGQGSQLWKRSGGIGIGGVNVGTQLHTGNVQGTEMFNLLGQIDEARIYNQALTAAEISSLANINNIALVEQTNQPVAQLKLDQTSGTKIKDSVGNNSGTLVNGASFTPIGKDLGGGISFDGIDDYVAIADSTDLNLGNHAQRTVSLWFNATDITRQTSQVIYEEGGAARGLSIYLDQGRLYAGGWNKFESNWSGTFLSNINLSNADNSALNSNTWHHVALVLDAIPESRTVQPEVLFAYLDGVEIGRGKGTQLWNHSADIGLGNVNQQTRLHSGAVKGTAAQGFAGGIASLEIYNQALTPELIKDLAAIETPVSEVVTPTVLPPDPPQPQDVDPPVTPPIVVQPVSSSQKFTADNPNFNYSGRVDWQDSQAPAFSYAGTAIEFSFTGTSLKIELSEDNWGSENYIDVYLDGSTQAKTIRLRREGGQPVVYDIASGLANQAHDVVIVKRVDYLTGEFQFHSITTDGNLLPAKPDSKKTIEVYGDSISAGRAVEYEFAGVRDPQSGLTELSNAYHSYGSILARDYDAELSLIAQSGVSLVNGYGFWNNFWNNGTGTEAFYNRIKPLHDAPLWDFEQYTPDLVVIALGQNDATTIGNSLSSNAWKERYKQFISNLRDKYPDSYFVGMFPNMTHDTRWDGYLTEAIAEYRSENNDNRVFSLIHQQVTSGHPRISEQQLMADTLKDFIDGTLTQNGFNWDVAD